MPIQGLFSGLKLINYVIHIQNLSKDKNSTGFTDEVFEALMHLCMPCIFNLRLNVMISDRNENLSKNTELVISRRSNFYDKICIDMKFKDFFV